MKKYLLLLSLAAVLVAGAAASGTFALFGDTETSEGNVFTAGTIDLAVSVEGGEGDENPWVSTIDGNWDADYKPGVNVEAAEITLNNVGTNPMDVWMMITKGACTGGDDSYHGLASSEPEYVAEGGKFTDGVPVGDNTPKDDIDTVIRYGLDVGGGYEIDIDDYTISDNGDLETTGIDGYYIWIGNIGPAGTINVEQNFKMDASAGNEYQGDTMTFTIEFYAQQSEGDTQPAAPGTELTGYVRPVTP